MRRALLQLLVPLAGSLIAAGSACSRSDDSKTEKPMPTVPAPPGVQQTQIKVDDKGFTPNEVKVEKGKPASLVFVRTTDSTCAKEVVFPDLKLEKDLPLNTPVRIDIPTTEARTLRFQCGMAMFKSAVLVQ
jgi:plastocyanin domain-containing protein